MGAVFSNLTKSGVQGDSQMYGSKPEAAIAAARQSVAPTTIFKSPEIPSPQINLTQADSPAVGPQDAPSVSVDPAGQAMPSEVTGTQGKTPKLFTPSFSEATNGGLDPLNKDTTTKGKILGMLLNAAAGASVGASTKNFGQGAEAGILFQRQRVQDAIRNQNAQQEAAIRQHQIADFPAKDAEQSALTQSQIDHNKAMAGYYSDRLVNNDTIKVGQGQTVYGRDGAVLFQGAQKPPVVVTPHTEAELRLAAQKGDKEAAAAIEAWDAERKSLRKAPAGTGSGDAASVTASKILANNNNNAEAAMNELNKRQAAGEVIPNSKAVAAAIKKQGGKSKRNGPNLGGAGTTPPPATGFDWNAHPKVNP